MSGTPRAVIFDLDGLILDSETPDYLSWKEVYARHGLDLTVQDWAGVVGRRDIDLYAPLRKGNVDIAAEGEARRRRLATLFEEYEAPGCVALEDSQPGVAAAKAAGLKCIAVPTVFTRCHDLSQADLVVPSLQAVTMEILSRLVSEGTVSDPQNPTLRHDPTQR